MTAVSWREKSCIPGLHLRRKPKVGMFLWGKIPDSCTDVERLTEHVLHKETKCSLLPGFIFGSNETVYPHLPLL